MWSYIGNESQITAKQRRLLKYLYEYRTTHGESPSMVDMVREVELGSNRSVIDMLRLLVKNGYLKSAPKISKSTTLTNKALFELDLFNFSVFTSDYVVFYPTADFVTPTFQQKASTKDPRLQWNNIPQPTGSWANGFTYESGPLDEAHLPPPSIQN